MENRKVLIVGGGIAGLCTGVYLRRLGFDTEILEMHTIPGGLATAWKKGGFTFENCIHWLVGSKDGGELNARWKEVFDIGRLEFFEDPAFQVLERGTDRITIYRDPDRLEAELLAKAPPDAAAVKEFVGLIRKIARLRMPEGDSFVQNIGAYLRLVPCLPTLSRYGKLSMADYSRRFTNPILRKFFSPRIGELSFMAIVFSLAWMTQGNAGYPIGGSLRMIGLIEDNYRKLGGRIRFMARVERILVENGRAVGVALEDGEELRADIVVSAADGHATPACSKASSRTPRSGRSTRTTSLSLPTSKCRSGSTRTCGASRGPCSSWTRTSRSIPKQSRTRSRSASSTSTRPSPRRARRTRFRCWAASEPPPICPTRRDHFSSP
jgi:phytoene dehydrogenase-like protein